MSTTTTPGRGRWRHRLVALAAPVLLSGLVVGTTASPASAIELNFPVVPCPAQPYDVLSSDSDGDPAWLAKPVVLASTRIFIKSDGRDVLNELDFPVSATFTSSVSKTHTVSQTTTHEYTTQTLIGTFRRSVADTVTDTKTTQIGISATVAVPPHSLLIGEYGIILYDIVYDSHLIFKKSNVCKRVNLEHTFTTAPTVDESWRFRLA
jgi:hypothetical protein